MEGVFVKKEDEFIIWLLILKNKSVKFLIMEDHDSHVSNQTTEQPYTVHLISE